MLDLLPNEIWSDSSIKILDPACKSWVFLREAAKRFIKWLENEFPDLQERIDHIMTKQLFWIGITNLTALLSRRSLYCSKNAKFDPNDDLWKYSICTQFKTSDWNIWFDRVEHERKNWNCIHCGASQSEYERNSELESHAYKFIHSTPEEINALFGLDPKMRFDVIIGNPPYQLNDWWGTWSSAMPIYQYFVEQSKKLNPNYLIMITPSRWFAWGKWLDEYRSSMLKSRNIKKIVDYANSAECFPWVTIAWWVSYFFIDKNYDWDCEVVNVRWNSLSSDTRSLWEFDVFIRDNSAIHIIRKVKEKDSHFVDDIVYSRNCFNLDSRESWHSQKESWDCVLYSLNWKSYINKSAIVDRDWILGSYKVIMTKAMSWWNKPSWDWDYLVISNTMKVLEPNEVCTETYLCLWNFNNIKNANNLKSYMKTKFFRFLLLQSLSSINISKEKFQFVPLQDFSKSRTDEELYKKYNLSQEEIDYIETMIKPMD